MASPPSAPAPPSKLDLNSIRAALIRQEDTIIFALIERAQFMRNSVVYEPGAAAYRELVSPSSATTGAGMSFLDYMLCETERLHARVRRYTSPDEYPFFPGELPPPELPLLDFPALLHPSCVNLNEQIKAVYMNRVLPDLCTEGDDEQHGSSVVADVAVLQAISKRVHYGLFVAESKFLGNPAGYTELIQAADEAGIYQLLTNMAVEERVLRRVHRKASIFGGDIEGTEGQPPAGTAGEGGPAPKVDPELIVALYREHIIPLTKEAEVQYLLQRLGPPLVACAGEAGSGSHLAAQSAFSTPGKQPPTFVASGAVAAVFEAVMSNKAHYGVVPLEQGEGGVHAATRKLLWSSDCLYVTGEVVRDEPRNSRGAAEPSESAPARAGAHDRRTYLVLAKRAGVAGPPTGADKSMALFSLDDEAGGLATALAAFHRHGVNLTFIQSYSDLLEEGRRIYAFLVQFQGHVAEEHVASALKELRECAGHVRVLGSFVPTK